MFSIIIPTYNNIDYLKLCIKSIKKNSIFNHQIILHINQGSDGTLNFAKENNIDFSFSENNLGICTGCNSAAKKAKNNYILYAHDDMYFCPEWDVVFFDEIKKIKHNNFYLSSTMIKSGQIHEYSCGDDINSFNEEKLLNDYKNLQFDDFQGTTWSPTLLPRSLWNKVGGFSEEYNPGTGSDPDLNMKLWNVGVRIFKGMGNSKVYHFGSIVTRQKESLYKTKTETGSKGNKIFLLKWGVTIKFFKKYYLRSDTKYDGELLEPNKSINYYIDLIKCKLSFFYYLFLMRFKL
jgi:glycosyltransferase involved in cell wall biosynthesis